MTVPFRYTFLNTVLQEGGTFIFFLLTGYTFRPALKDYSLPPSIPSVFIPQPLKTPARWKHGGQLKSSNRTQ
jgi:hypothetical protein